MLTTLLFRFIIISLVYCYPKDLTFEEWKVEYDRKYDSPREEKYRRDIYHKNLIQIGIIRDLHPEIEFKPNQFADISIEEFKSKVLMTSRIPTKFHTSTYHHPEPIDAPEEFDWRDHGVVTPVKDQGTVGSCWAFGTTGNLEGQWAIKSGALVPLSEEQLVDCDGSEDVGAGRADCGVFGGWPYLALGYIKRAGGIESEASYPYCVGTGECFPCPPTGYNTSLCGAAPEYCNHSHSCHAKIKPKKFVPGLKVKGFQAVPKNETTIMESLVGLGPLSVLIDATFLQFYHSGVWESRFCHQDTLDHAVLVVGYGTHKGLFEDKPYWLVKNSWGEKWGDEGYFMMLRGRNMCGVAEEVVSAELE